MVFRLRVTLTGIKGFFRIYHVNGATTLYTLHKQMRADMEFPQDQLIMFKALDVEGAVVGRYGLFDLGSGTVDQGRRTDRAEPYLFTWNFVLPVAKKSAIWRAAARPALTLASEVWAPIFLGVAKTR